MTDMLQDGLDWLEAQRKAHLSRAVTYRRRNAAVEVRATPAATSYEADDGYGIVLETQARDYLVAAEDLVLEGERTLPERGDRIEEVQVDGTHVFAVTDLGRERHYRFCDPAGKTLRIHTKHVETT